MIRVVIADAQDLSRLGLQTILENNKSNIQIVGVAKNKRELVAILTKSKVDIVYLDPIFNKDLGWHSIKQIRLIHPSCRIILIADNATYQDVQLALQMGCEGFLTKTCDNNEIIQSLYDVYGGTTMMCNKLLCLIQENRFNKSSSDCSSYNLSSRELEIIKHTALGKSAKAIAGDLYLSTHTVYTHKKNIMKKLGVSTTSELIVYALDNNLTH